jgi:hypothetical protein
MRATRVHSIRTVLAIAGASAFIVAGTATSAAASETTIVCETAKVRAEPEDDATVLGIAYEDDKITYDAWVYKKNERTWYTRGTVTRQDGERIPQGYVPYKCANPYKDPLSDAPPKSAQ